MSLYPAMQDWRAIFGGNVRRFRQQKQLTREELAFEAEIDLTYVGGIERGTKNPSEAGATVRDSAGNGCGTHTAVVAFSPPVPQAPFVVPVTHVFKVTKYDPTTGIGDQSLTEYSGGTCNGAIFNNTGATLSVTGTLHFVVSEGGNRIDNIVTSLNFAGPSGPVPATNFLLTFMERRQSSQNQQ